MKTLNQVIVLVLFAVISTVTITFVANRNNTPAQRSPAVISQPSQTVVIQPVTTTAPTVAPTITVTSQTALEAEQADLVIFDLDPTLPCLEWAEMALQVGWQPQNLPTLLNIIYRESRCQVDAWNGSDSGLTQINRIHTEWLAQMGLSWPDDMMDPKLNLKFALDLYNSRTENGQCGWTPWSVKCS